MNSFWKKMTVILLFVVVTVFLSVAVADSKIKIPILDPIADSSHGSSNNFPSYNEKVGGNYAHNGNDSQKGYYAAIVSVRDGTVKRVFKAGSMNCIVIQDAEYKDNLYFHYLHVANIPMGGKSQITWLKPGDKVSAGQLIALMGDTGAPGATHLHFSALWKKNKASWTNLSCIGSNNVYLNTTYNPAKTINGYHGNAYYFTDYSDKKGRADKRTIKEAQLNYSLSYTKNVPVGNSLIVDYLYPSLYKTGTKSEKCVFGVVTSNAKISKVRICVENASGNIVTEATKKPNTYMFDLHSMCKNFSLHTVLKIPGTYYYIIEAEDANGNKVYIRESISSGSSLSLTHKRKKGDTTDYKGGRWYKFTTKEVPVYQSMNQSSNIIERIPASHGVIVTGIYTNPNKQKWYQVDKGYIRSEDLGNVSDSDRSNKEDIGDIVHNNLSIKVKAKSSALWLTAQPYKDKDKMIRVNNNTPLTVVAVILNKTNPRHYWVQFDNGYYACANTVERVEVSEPEAVSIKDKVFPSGNLPLGKGFDIRGTVSSPYKIVSATGVVYSAGYKYEKTISVDGNKFDLYSSAINLKKQGGIDFAKIPKGSYIFRLIVDYEKVTWKNQTRDDIDPIQSVGISSQFSSAFTIGGGSGTDNLGSIGPSGAVSVSSVNLDTSSKTLMINETFYLKESILPDNATNKKVNWFSSDNSVATVVNGKVIAVGKGTATITAEAEDGSGKQAACTIIVKKPVTGITVAPSTVLLYVNDTPTAQLTANVMPSDASDTGVTWSSSNSNIVSVNQNGSIMAKAVGSATIIAKANDNSGKQAACQVKVLAYVDTVKISGANSVHIGSIVKLTPTITPENAANKNLVWSSSDSSVATVDNDGKVTGINTGTVTITATAKDRGNKKGTYSVSVLQPVTNIKLSGASTVLNGNTLTLTATVQPSNASNKVVSWSSDNNSVATVNNGIVTAVAVGNATIWASSTDGSGVKTPYNIRVLQPVTDITISGDNVVPVDGTINLNASVMPANADNHTLNWTASPSTLASVNSQGVVTGLQPGTVTITVAATDGSNISKQYTIQVVQQVVAIKIEGENLVHTGNTLPLTAVVTSEEPLSDTSVTWNTSDSEVVTVDTNGVLTGISNGTATITAVLNAENYYTATHQVTVDTLVNGITVTGDKSIDAECTAQLIGTVFPTTASNKQLTWTSSDNTVAMVDSQGMIRGVSSGTATITASAMDGSGVNGILTVVVYPLPEQVSISGESDLHVNTTAQLYAEVLPANARNKSIIWSSSDDSVATVSANGLVTAKGNGTAVITATSAGNTGVEAQHKVSITTLVSEVILNAPERIDVGEMGTVSATVLPSTASNKKIIWTSSDEDIAVVDDNGDVFGISGGYVTITATTVDGSEKIAEADVQIFQYAQSISADIEPVAYVGQKLRPYTIVLPEDTSDPSVTWTSSNENVIRIDETELGDIYELTATCLQPGVAKITAIATDGGGASGYAYVQVYPYTELTCNTATYNLYTSGEANSNIGRISLTADCSVRAAEDKHGAVWTIEHISGDYAAALGINERVYSFAGFSLANGVDLKLLGVNHAGTDTYQVTCTINGLPDTCVVTVNVEEPDAPLPDSVSLPTSIFSATLGEVITVDVTPVVSPATSELPDDANPFLYGVDSFSRYAQVSMGDDVFSVSFNKAGVYTAFVRYQGSNYQYDAYATFVITTPEGTVPPPIESLSINNSMMYLLPGETAKFDVQISPANADESTLVWSSSDPDVVSVAADGTMTAVSKGTSVITVSAGNGISATGFVAVTDSLLSIDWNPNDIIEVYVGGESRTVIQKVYLTARASAQLTEAPEWTIKRQYGNNLTLTCEPVTTTNGSGQLLYGCAIILKSVSAVGTTEYELTCSDGVNSASTTIQVNANSIEDTLPSLLQWNNTVFTGTVNQRMAIYPVVQCWPNGTALPDEVTISIDGDSYWNTALKTSDYTISRGMITFAFNEPGVYTAKVVYSCSNMRYLVPITVRVADSSGNVPVRLMQVTLNETEISMKAGDAAQLYTAFSPSDATNKAVTWSSDNPSVATVSANGLITAVANGKANITCTPSDTNCTPVTCVVIVEDTFTVTQYQEMNYQYLQGDVGEPVAGFRLSNGTAKRVETEGLTPVWTLTRVSGHAADVELREYKGTQFIVVTNLIAAGTDTYQVTCTAGNYSWTGQASLEVHDLGATAPANVTLAETVYTTSIGEEVTLDFTPVCEPAGASIPSELYAEYIGIGDIYSALADPYQYSLFTAGDRFNLGFKKPGTYLLSRQYTSCNLTYVTECTIIVDDGPLNLIKCTDEDAVVYIGGQSSIASTCIIRDTSMEELYGDQITWNAERLSGDCLTVALRADQSSASLYVVNAKEEGEEVWRVSCTFKGITDSVDITIHAVQPRTELPENAALYQTEFDGMIGNSITVPLAVECSPEGTSLPVTDDKAWSFSTDGNAKAHALWSFENNQMKIVFTESGYYGGNLIYQSGNISYRFPISFAITDEESVQAEPVNLAISLSDDSVTVYPEGETQIAIVNAVLTDSLDAYSLSSVAAYAERNHAVWSVQILSGNSCSLSINSASAAGVQLVLDSMNGSGDVTYQILCSVAGKTATAQGTVHVAASSEARPQPEMKQSYFTTPTGTVLSIDASMYDHTHTIKLCSGKDSIWDNANALAAMGYEYDTSGDLLLPVFYEPGSYVTTITNRIGNLVFNKEVIIAVYTAHSIPSSPSRLSFPAALQEIEEEAFEGLNVNIIDLRGSSVRIIGARAFADIHGLMRVYIPGSVTSISTQAFEGCTDFVICCAEGSYADTWARGLHYPVVNNME